MEAWNLTVDDHRFLRSGSNHTHHHHHSSHHDGGNLTITTSVSIRVTPYEDYFVSWYILWFSFLIASMVAARQVYLEKQLVARRTQERTESSDTPAVSNADVTRSMFRRLLLAAMVSRMICIPIQIWVDPIWWQFVGDTFPEVVFCSAWMLFALFFVQLVGIASGSGTNTSSPSIIHGTIYVVYAILIGTQVYSTSATVFLYALLCGIYAMLFAVVVVFFPRLLVLLRPTFARSKSLSIRLVLSTLLCAVVFGFHMFDYARLVIAPPKRVYWWLRYGALELLPAFLFLFLMVPSTTKGERNLRSPEEGGQPRRRILRRVGSDLRRKNEAAGLLLKAPPPSSYAATDSVSNNAT